MPDEFLTAFAVTVGLEGGFSDNPNDSGGATKYGITERVAREEGYDGDMRELPLEEAQRIAKVRYWDQLRLDAVAALSPSIAEELFDTSYNMGQGVAGRFLQRALNQFNQRGKHYPDITEDGLVGGGTLAALKAYLKKRGSSGEVVMLRALNAQQGGRYFDLTERRSKDEDFVFGWFLNRVVI